MGSHQFPCRFTGRQLIAESFSQDRPFTKICAGPSTSRSLVLKMKKLLDDLLDLMWWPRGRKKWHEQAERWIYAVDSSFASERVKADIYHELLRQHVVPWVQRDVAWWKICLLADSASASPPKSLSSRLKNSDFQWICCNICQTWIRWTSNLQPLAAKRPGYISC